MASRDETQRLEGAAPGCAAAARAEPGEWLFTVVLFLVALAPRLFVALAWAREPVWDGHYYHFGATRIAEGFGYTEDVLVGGVLQSKPWCHYPVGYSAFLAGLYAVFGSDLAVAPVAQAVLGALLAVVGHRLARYFTTSGRAQVAGALIALNPGLIVYTAVLMTELLAALGMLLAALIACAARRPAQAFVGSGVVVGLTTLVRPPSLLVAPLLSFLWTRYRGWAVLGGALALGVSVLVVLPWTWRNCKVMDGCAFVSTNGGWNLAIGALSDTGRFRSLRAVDGCPVVTGQVQQDRCWGRVGVDVIRDDPARWLALAPRKLSQTFDHESFAIEYLREADPRTWNEPRRIAGRGLLTFAHRALLVLAALGMVAWPSSRHPAPSRRWQAGALIGVLGLAAYVTFHDEHPFYLMVAGLLLLAVLPLPGAPPLGGVGRFLVGTVLAASVTHVVFFGDDRYHLVVTPALCLLGAAALRAPEPRAKAESRSLAQGEL
jgi:4-amino-4-deoxy-L-arabinose transferase-like glycosyltransferase